MSGEHCSGVGENNGKSRCISDWKEGSSTKVTISRPTVGGGSDNGDVNARGRRSLQAGKNAQIEECGLWREYWQIERFPEGRKRNVHRYPLQRRDRLINKSRILGGGLCS